MRISRVVAVEKGDRSPQHAEMVGDRGKNGLNDLFEIEALVENLADLKKQRQFLELPPVFGVLVGRIHRWLPKKNSSLYENTQEMSLSEYHTPM